jgi:hypothetical protein
MKLKSNIRLATCCYTHAAAYLIIRCLVLLKSKRSSKSIENKFRKLFHKIKKKILYFFPSSLVLARWPNQPASPLLPQAQEGTAPPFPAPTKLARSPSSWAGPQAKPQHARSRPPSADARGPRPPSLPRGAAASVVSYLPPGWPGGFPFSCRRRVLFRFVYSTHQTVVARASSLAPMSSVTAGNGAPPCGLLLRLVCRPLPPSSNQDRSDQIRRSRSPDTPSRVNFV